MVVHGGTSATQCPWAMLPKFQRVFLLVIKICRADTKGESVVWMTNASRANLPKLGHHHPERWNQSVEGQGTPRTAPLLACSWPSTQLPFVTVGGDFRQCFPFVTGLYLGASRAPRVQYSGRQRNGCGRWEILYGFSAFNGTFFFAS